jgi:hypothetical protein
MSREPTEQPVDIPPSQIARRPRAGLIIGAFVLIVAGAAGVLYIADKKESARKTADVSLAWSRLSSCLIGDPVASGEKASARFRAIQFAVAETDVKSGKEPATEAWPYRCHAQSQALIHVLNKERMAKAGADDLAARTDALAKRIEGGDQEHRLKDFSDALDAIWAKASEAKLVATKSADVKAPPPPAKPRLSLADLAKVRPLAQKPLPMNAIKSEVHAQRDLVLAVADASLGGAMICTASDATNKVVCKKLPANVAAIGGDPLLHAARDPGAPPIVVFGPQASVGAYTTDTGAPVIAGEKFGWAYRRKDGSSVALTYKNEYGKKFRLSIGARSAAEPDNKEPGGFVEWPGRVKNENLYYAAALVPGFVLWRGANDQDELRLFAQAIEGSALGPVKEVGEVDSWYTTGNTPQFLSCHSGEALTVAVKDEFTWHVTTQRDGKWTVPVKVYASFDRMSCHKAEATFTQVTSNKGDQVLVINCTNGLCSDTTAKLPGLGARVAVATEGGIVTVARVFDRGGVFMRTGAASALANAVSIPLFDDSEKGESWLRGMDLYPLGKAAALILSTTSGTYLLRVEADGTVSPLDVDQAS